MAHAFLTAVSCKRVLYACTVIDTMPQLHRCREYCTWLSTERSRRRLIIFIYVHESFSQAYALLDLLQETLGHLEKCQGHRCPG